MPVRTPPPVRCGTEHLGRAVDECSSPTQLAPVRRPRRDGSEQAAVRIDDSNSRSDRAVGGQRGSDATSVAAIRRASMTATCASTEVVPPGWLGVRHVGRGAGDLRVSDRWAGRRVLEPLTKHRLAFPAAGRVQVAVVAPGITACIDASTSGTAAVRMSATRRGPNGRDHDR